MNSIMKRWILIFATLIALVGTSSANVAADSTLPTTSWAAVTADIADDVLPRTSEDTADDPPVQRGTFKATWYDKDGKERGVNTPIYGDLQSARHDFKEAVLREMKKYPPSAH